MFEKIIKVPYTTSPTMERYVGPLINYNPSEYIIKQKHIEYNTLGPAITFESEIAKNENLVKKVCDLVGVKADNIIDLGLSLEEDISILYEGKLEAIFFAFPSGWNPGNKKGMTLQELHGPVADGDLLRKMSNKLSQLLCGKYCYTRTVWTLAPTGMLSMHTDYQFDEPKTINDLWFRCEAQKTSPLIPNKSAVFFADVKVVPYKNLSDEYRDLIRQSINSMSDAILKYKKLERTKKIINTA